MKTFLFVIASILSCHCEQNNQCECIPVYSSSSSHILFGPVCRSYSWGCVDDPQTGWATDDVEGWYTTISIDEDTGCPYISSGCSSSHSNIDARQDYPDSAFQEDTIGTMEDGSYDSGPEDVLSVGQDGSWEAGSVDAIAIIPDGSVE